MSLYKIMKEAIIDNNPVLVQLVGLCSVLAVTSSIVNALSMGIAVTIVLVGSNLVISLFKGVIPAKIRIPAFIVVIATFVTIIEMFLKAYLPPIYESLGIFIPLIVVNCIILARAESFAYKNKVIPSIADGFGSGLGYTLAVFLLAAVREIFGNGTVLSGTAMEIQLFGSAYQPIGLFLAPAGAFIVLGILVAVFNTLTKKKASN